MKFSKRILPPAIIVLTILVSTVLIVFKPKASEKPQQKPVPSVEVITVEPADLYLNVESQGTVNAKTVSALTPEVSGRIIDLSPNFRAGGFFKKDEVLLRIDPADYYTNLALERANLAQAEFNLEQERAFVEQAAIDWQDLGRGEASPLALREPQLKQAQAQLESAQARVVKAERDLARTELRAPYDGRVLERLVGLGQYVVDKPATTLAKIYATDAAELRLPLTDIQMAQLDLPLAGWENNQPTINPKVTLSANYGEKEYQWQGEIVRSEAAIDVNSRLIYVVAEVNEPYVQSVEAPGRPPLQVGMFVYAEIQGRKVEGVYTLPRYAVRQNDSVFVVDANQRLFRRPVSLVQENAETAIVGNGLEPGDRVVISPLEYVVDGMRVQPVESAQ